MRLLIAYLVMQRWLTEGYCLVDCPNMTQSATTGFQVNIAKVLSRSLEKVELSMNGIEIPRKTTRCKEPDFNETSDIGKLTKAGKSEKRWRNP